MARRYDPDQIAKILAMHEATGALRNVSPPENGGGRSTWRIDVPGQPAPIELTPPQAWALAVGLAAGKRAYAPLDLLGDGS